MKAHCEDQALVKEAQVVVPSEEIRFLSGTFEAIPVMGQNFNDLKEKER